MTKKHLNELSDKKLGDYKDKAEAEVNKTHPLKYISKDKLRKTTNHAFGAIEAGKRLAKEGEQDLLAAAYEAKPIDFNNIFNDKIIDRIKALVDAKRIDMANEYWTPNENEEKPKNEDFNPGGHKGKLHHELGIPVGQKIPTKKLDAAAHSKDSEVRGDAIRAKTMKGWKHK